MSTPAAKLSVKMKKSKLKKKTKIPKEAETYLPQVPDLIHDHLDILFIGINPGVQSSLQGHNYSGPSNHFWKCFNAAQLIDRKVTHREDATLLDDNIGFTNLVARPSRAMSDLNQQEMAAGGRILTEKLKQYQPKIAVFVGKGIYETFTGGKCPEMGVQKLKLPEVNSTFFVMPATSGICTAYAHNRAEYFHKLKEFLDSIKDEKK